MENSERHPNECMQLIVDKDIINGATPLRRNSKMHGAEATGYLKENKQISKLNLNLIHKINKKQIQKI